MFLFREIDKNLGQNYTKTYIYQFLVFVEYFFNTSLGLKYIQCVILMETLIVQRISPDTHLFCLLREFIKLGYWAFNI